MSNDIITFQQPDVTLNFSRFNVPVTVISGATGCGKSYLVKEISEYLKHNYSKHDLKLMDIAEADIRQKLEDVLQEIGLRQELFAKNGCSSFVEFRFAGNGIPQIVVVIDSMTLVHAEEGAMELLSKIAAKAETAGVHLIIASQVPNIEGVTDLGYWVQRVIFTDDRGRKLDWDGVPSGLGSFVVCQPGLI